MCGVKGKLLTNVGPHRLERNASDRIVRDDISHLNVI